MPVLVNSFLKAPKGPPNLTFLSDGRTAINITSYALQRDLENNLDIFGTENSD